MLMRFVISRFHCTFSNYSCTFSHNFAPSTQPEGSHFFCCFFSAFASITSTLDSQIAICRLT